MEGIGHDRLLDRSVAAKRPVRRKRLITLPGRRAGNDQFAVDMDMVAGDRAGHVDARAATGDEHLEAAALRRDLSGEDLLAEKAAVQPYLERIAVIGRQPTGALESATTHL